MAGPAATQSPVAAFVIVATTTLVLCEHLCKCLFVEFRKQPIIGVKLGLVVGFPISFESSFLRLFSRGIIRHFVGFGCSFVFGSFDFLLGQFVSFDVQFVLRWMVFASSGDLACRRSLSW